MKSYLRVLIGVSIFLVISACTSFPSQNVDPAKNDRDNFRKDLTECKEDHPESSAGLHYQRWMDCMKIKGWR
jgi:hypothetical protein